MATRPHAPVSATMLIAVRGAGMAYEDIIETVRRAAGGLGHEAAERAAAATLQTLAERLEVGESRQLRQELPAELRPFSYTETAAEALGIDEFLDRVARREGTDVETALLHARAVFFALGDALSPEAAKHLAASLPQTFEPLVTELQRRDAEIMPAEEFWDRVGQWLGRDTAGPRRVTAAVLQTLAERIAAGEVEDLIAQLDPQLHPPLRQGTAAARGAQRMPLPEFLHRVATREGAPDVDRATLAEIAGHVRAVFATLAEAVTSEEWFDVTAQLPGEYQPVLPGRPACGR